MKEHEIVERALRIDDPEQRRRFLHGACGDDRDMRERIEHRLLETDETMVTDRPTVGSGGDPNLADIAETTGSVIGPYRLSHRLGEGGFGVVYMAEQEEPVRRRVALKIIKLGMDTREIIARFESERQTLALMDHPGIARVLDAGATTTGRPYFVMEMVDGVSITRYCDENRLSTRGRLELFMSVCQAVQHAHQKGVIHRDIKPSNVLVAVVDGKPVPKVIDFGIAKATDQQAAGREAFTRLGQFIGTPEYMSPEQAQESGLDIDTRSDIYSLGVLLYELLIGRTPFDGERLRSAGYTEIRRIIREEDPPRPSTRISTLGEEATDIAGRRRLDVRQLTGAVRGDLDWVIMKSLEKDRARRYETADGFARDIARYLADEPVSAGPPGAAYRMRKFARRNRAGVATAAIGLLMLVAFAATMAVQAGRIASERDRANREREISDRVAEFQASMLRKVQPLAMGRELVADLRDRVEAALHEAHTPEGEVTASLAAFDRLVAGISPTDAARRVIDVNILEPANEAITEEFGDDPATEGRLRHAVGKTYRSLGMAAKAEPQFARALELRGETLGPAARDTLESKALLGDMHQRQGRGDEAEAMLNEVIDAWSAKGQEDHQDALLVRMILGVVYLNTERSDEAIGLLEDVLEAQERVVGPDHIDTAHTLSNLATAYLNRRRFEDARPLVDRALAIYRREHGDENTSTLATRKIHAQLLQRDGLTEEGIAELLAVIDDYARLGGNLHPATLRAREELGFMYRRANRFQDAIDAHQVALDQRREALGPRHPDTVRSMSDFAINLSQMERYQEAVELLRGVLDINREVYGPDHPETIDAAGNLGVTYWFMGRLDLTEPLFVQTYESSKRHFGEDHPKTAFQANNLAILYTRRGRLDEAEALLAQVMETRTKLLGERHPDTLAARASLASLLFSRERYEAAEEVFVPVVSGRKEVLGNDDPLTQESVYNLALVYRRLDREDDAERLLLENLETRRSVLGPRHEQTLDSLQELAALYIDTGRSDEARPLTAEVVAARKDAALGEDATAGALDDAARLLLLVDFEELRDPALALELARRANELTGHSNPEYLKHLALAYDATGDRKRAADTQRRALDALPDGAPSRAEYEETLSGYDGATD